jgi:TPP-dependent 2-oxoacid decarboxylase
MPLTEAIRNSIHSYCKADLPGDLQWHVDQFSFIKEIELQKRLGRAFYSARYISKLMEALLASPDEIHPFVKFQIMQYASIFEAVISYLLWSRYKDHVELRTLQTHKAYKPVSALSSRTSMSYESEAVFTCVYRDAKTSKNSIAFKDKVDCAVRIGFVDSAYAQDIKRTYELRNLAHIEAEIEHAKTGYWRMKPFLEKIVATIEEESA